MAMATIKQGILGGFSGTVGTVVGGKWNGLDTMRGKDTHRKDSKSAVQLQQRARFKIIIKLMKPFKTFLHIGFRKHKEGITAYNAAISCNIRNKMIGIQAPYSIDYSKLMVSQGIIPGSLNAVAVAKAGGLIEFSWQDNSSITNAMANDRSILVTYNQEKSKVITSEDSHLRISGSHSIKWPAGFTGDTIHCYIAFQNANETRISNSQYAGMIHLL